MKLNKDQIKEMQMLALIVVGNALYQAVRVMFYGKSASQAFSSWFAGTIGVLLIGTLIVVGSRTLKQKHG